MIERRQPMQMPPMTRWQDTFAAGMIWHRLRDNDYIIDACLVALEYHKPPPMQEEQPMTAAEYKDYWREEEATTGREI